jgi:hypothetical protein
VEIMLRHLKRPVISIIETSRKIFQKSIIKTLIYTALNAPGFYPISIIGFSTLQDQMGNYIRAGLEKGEA